MTAITVILVAHSANWLPVTGHWLLVTDYWKPALLFVAALLGGALNAVAGGGSFIAFPALVFTGIPPIMANATNTVALWPGSVASVGAYRVELRTAPHRALLAVASFIGGIGGAVLLLRTPPGVFERLIPYLLLLATLLFAFSPSLTARLRARKVSVQGQDRGRGTSLPTLAGLTLAQLVIATYGGFFGGGIGILMLATLGLMGMDNIHTMNALKTLLASCINGVAVLTFVIAHAVVWPQAILMIVGAIVGGYAGAYYARRLEPQFVRRFVIVVGLVMTAYFFARQA